MTKLITNDLKVLLADHMYNSFIQIDNEPAATYHMVGCRPEAFSNTIPTPNDSVFEHKYDIHDNILFGKRIRPVDVRYMIRNIPWVDGNSYDIYDDRDNDLITKNFYVIADQTDGSYAVFKCIHISSLESNPTVSSKPNKNQTAADEDVYITGDGYHWKYMFEISATEYAKFATTNFVPYIEDVAVTANAVSGSIDAIDIDSSGLKYNNYASGTVRESSIGGDTKQFSLESDSFDRVVTYDIVYTSNTANTFTEGDSIDITVPSANAITVTAYKTGTSSVSFEIANTISHITQSTVETSNTIAITSGGITADLLRVREENVGKLSSIDDYYIGASFYIRSGSGAGEIRTITDYTVTGNEKIIMVDTAFTTTPSLSSTYSITPKINIKGDGIGAQAIPIIDTTANSIVDIQILNRGLNYTYATATANGYSGDSTVSASLRPIIAPVGGHGSDIKEELYASQLGLSTTFSNTDVTGVTSYNQIAVIKNLKYDNVEVTLTTSASAFSVGESLTQDNVKVLGEIESTSANTITLTNVLGAYEVNSNSVIGSTSNAYGTVSSINTDTETFNKTIDLSITPILSSFSVGENIVQTNTDAVGYIIAANTSVLVIARVFGTFSTLSADKITGSNSGATAIVTAKTESGIVDNSGKVIYIENMEEIQRSSNTEETIKLVIKF